MVLTSAAAAGAGAAAAGAGGAAASTSIMATLASLAAKAGGMLATAGKAAMASGVPQAMGSGALWGAGINAATSALQGNSVGDVLADAGKGAAVGAATGGIAKGVSIGVSKAGSLIKGAKAAKTGAEAGTKATEVTTTAAPTGQTVAQAPTPGPAETTANVGGKPTLRPKASLKGQPVSVQLKGTAKTTGANLRGAANTVKTKAGKIAGQVGVQGALSIASGVAGAKQANAANEVSKQSLLFQQQTYADQKAETERTKAKLKQDAWSDYSSASLFGEQLYGSDSNNTLLTSYHTNGTGNIGNYSLINSSVTTSKLTDLT